MSYSYIICTHCQGRYSITLVFRKFLKIYYELNFISTENHLLPCSISQNQDAHILFIIPHILHRQSFLEAQYPLLHRGSFITDRLRTSPKRTQHQIASLHHHMKAEPINSIQLKFMSQNAQKMGKFGQPFCLGGTVRERIIEHEIWGNFNQSVSHGGDSVCVSEVFDYAMIK